FRYQVIWAMYNKGEWRNDLDHKNTDSIDDKIENLRVSTGSQNSANTKIRLDNKTGYKGVSWKKDKCKYLSIITISGIQKHLGYFDDPKEAHEAYCKAAKEHFGEFANFG